MHIALRERHQINHKKVWNIVIYYTFEHIGGVLIDEVIITLRITAYIVITPIILYIIVIGVKPYCGGLWPSLQRNHIFQVDYILIPIVLSFKNWGEIKIICYCNQKEIMFLKYSVVLHKKQETHLHYVPTNCELCLVV